MILAIDPGSTQSAYVVLDDDLKPVSFGKIANAECKEAISKSIYIYQIKNVAIENVACYGMAVGKEVFETCVWIGRFTEKIESEARVPVKYIYRKDEKINLCGSMKAKDSNIRQALIDRFGVVGVKADKGWFYGVSKDVWSAIAVGVTYADLFLEVQNEKTT